MGRDATLTVRFDGFPDPTSFTYPHVLLQSGPSRFDAVLRVDLVDDTLHVQPRTRLAANTSYTLVLSDTLRALDGRRLGQRHTLTFTTGDAPGASEPLPTPHRFTVEIAPLLQLHGCATRLCHDGAAFAGGLDLEAPGNYAELVGAPSAEVSLPRVSPGLPSSSYLLRKLLGTPDIRYQRMPFMDGGAPLSPSELRIISDWIETGAAL